MKRLIVLLVLGLLVSIESTSDAQEVSYAPYGSHFGRGASLWDLSAEQIQMPLSWGYFRHGDLWEFYCRDKRYCHSPHRQWHPLVRARCYLARSVHVHIFHDLLGIGGCSCGKGCGHGGKSCQDSCGKSSSACGGKGGGKAHDTAAVNNTPAPPAVETDATTPQPPAPVVHEPSQPQRPRVMPRQDPVPPNNIAPTIPRNEIPGRNREANRLRDFIQTH